MCRYATDLVLYTATCFTPPTRSLVQQAREVRQQHVLQRHVQRRQHEDRERAGVLLDEPSHDAPQHEVVRAVVSFCESENNLVCLRSGDGTKKTVTLSATLSTLDLMRLLSESCPRRQHPLQGSRPLDADTVLLNENEDSIFQ